ncbi:MAG: cupin domain-containing protein [Chloroflexota bacterium]
MLRSIRGTGSPRRRPRVYAAAQEREVDMQAWELNEIDASRATEGRLYREFLRVPDLSAGLYVLERGATDPQSPHTEDELYYVAAGRGVVTVGDETREVTTGSLVFVPATVPHRFGEITERLEILVVFGPAEAVRG